MSDTPRYAKGDWLCFRQGGLIGIGEVRYITEQKYSPYKPQYITTFGVVDEPDVLEVRRAHPEGTSPDD